VGLFLRTRRFRPRAILHVVGGALLFAAFLSGTLMFRKAEATDELATAIVYAKSGEPTQQRQAMASFRKFPDARSRWVPLVVAMLGQPDPVTREAAATLLGETRAAETVAALGARLAKGVEPEDGVRESVVRALRAIGDPHAVPPLVEAAARDDEADLAVAMATAAFELAAAGQDAELRRAGDVLVHVITNADAPGGARRDAGEALRAHIALGGSTKDDAAASAWWHDHRDTAVWQAPTKLFVAPAAGG
jgi:HEAT repeat protein